MEITSNEPCYLQQKGNLQGGKLYSVCLFSTAAAFSCNCLKFIKVMTCDLAGMEVYRKGLVHIDP